MQRTYEATGNVKIERTARDAVTYQPGFVDAIVLALCGAALLFVAPENIDPQVDDILRAFGALLVAASVWCGCHADARRGLGCNMHGVAVLLGLSAALLAMGVLLSIWGYPSCHTFAAMVLAACADVASVLPLFGVR